MDINKLCPGCMQEVENRSSVGICPHCGYNLNEMKAELHQMQPFTILAGKYLVGKVIGEGGFPGRMIWQREKYMKQGLRKEQRVQKMNRRKVSWLLQWQRSLRRRVCRRRTRPRSTDMS